MRYFLPIIFLLTSFHLKAQYLNNFTYGIKAGGVYSRITNLPEMIIGREYNKIQFDITNKGVLGVEGGVFVNYKLPDTRVALQPEILYRKSGDKVNYHNEVTGKEYTLSFNYSYLIFGTSIKLYPYRGVTTGVGVYYAKNLLSNNLEYESNEFGGRNDTSYRQFYREGIVGEDDFNLSFSVGYEFMDFFNVEAKYYLGVGDVVSNRSTSFQFTENTNRNSVFALSVGYNFSNW